MDRNFTNLCEEFDLDELFNNQILSCKKCKKIEAIRDDIVNKKYSLNYFDFIKPDLARNYMDTTGKINYQWAINL